MIKNIIFDVGDVLIGYRWKEMLLDHGIPDDIAQRVGENIFSDPIWRKFDSGFVSIEELLEHYIQLYPEDEEYQPSSEVKRISTLITNETGVGDMFTDDKTTEKPTQTMPD